jgi:hypothetical protein
MSVPLRTTAASLKAFLEGIVDYAGLFAPASLDMTTSVNNYARYRNHPQRWALGRFVLPVARLDEFMNARAHAVSEPWHLTGILSAGVASDLAAVDAFNRKASGTVMDSLEVRACNREEIDLIRLQRPRGTTVLYEIAPERADELLPVLRSIGGCAKLRTGGVVAEAFPPVEHVAGFIARCAELGVPFKASAGLHHPLRSVRPLTYEPDAPEAWMHGFLNLFTASAIAWCAVRSGSAVPRDALATCLADPERANWHFDEDALVWSGDQEPIRIDVDALRRTRSRLALSFGSCSFEEPIHDLCELDLL